MANRKGKKKPAAGRKAAQPQRESSHPGARKPVKRATAEQILGIQDECELWDRLLHSEDDRVAFAALKYLTDRRDGKLFPALNGSFGNPGQIQQHDPRQTSAGTGPHLADSKITAALHELLPPPSPAVTVGDRRD